MSSLLLLLRQWLQTSCVSSWRSPYIWSSTCVRCTRLEYSRRGRSTMYPCRCALVGCSSHLLHEEGSTPCIHPASCFCPPDVMSPRPEPVYSGYSSLCEAAHWEGNDATWLRKAPFTPNSQPFSNPSPEWCWEGCNSHHGQRAPPSREICVWDFPADAAVDQVWISVLPW